MSGETVLGVDMLPHRRQKERNEKTVLGAHPKNVRKMLQGRGRAPAKMSEKCPENVPGHFPDTFSYIFWALLRVRKMFEKCPENVPGHFPGIFVDIFTGARPGPWAFFRFFSGDFRNQPL